MNLLVDSGNSFIKWAQGAGEALTLVNRCHSKAVASLQEMWNSYDVPDRVIIANVAGGHRASEIINAASSLWNVDAEFAVSSRECCGLMNCYNNPGQLGVDRWMAMVAAFRLTSDPVIVVDCGTAVTIDLVNKAGVFVGGVIMPGLNTAYQSLRAGTDAVEDINAINKVINPAARSTADGVAIGVLLGLVGGIERVVSELSSQVGKTPSVIITGGDAEKLLPNLTMPAILQPDLVLEGLRIFSSEKLSD